MKALLDTSFFFRLLDSNDILNSNAKAYYNYMLVNNFELYISTIAIAEFCVRNPLDHLPLKDVRVMPFNIFHAEEAGHIYGIILNEKERRGAERLKREVVQNDSKQFGQALYEAVDWYVSADTEAIKVYNIFINSAKHPFQYIDIHIPCKEQVGELF